MSGRGKAFLLWLCLVPASAAAQINTDRMMLMGRNALYYEDYVLSIRRFNMVIAAKPYLPEPYFFRALAKFYLEDYTGAEEDCGEAIDRNPFLPDNYELRGLCRIHLENFDGAVADYRKLLEIEPQNESALYNMALCYVQLKQYGEAMGCVERMLQLSPRKASLYTLKAQVCFEQKDTVAAMGSLDQALEIDPYNGQAWNMRAAVYAQRGEFELAEDALDKTIRQFPKQAEHYINRALARYHRRNLRGAMEDYDTALELDSINYIGHFNRGLLRAQVGDDNRAIEDFNFVLKLEPDNMIALFNRALMLNNTGDLQGAIRDINAVIKEFPNFWTGYQFRAEVRRKLGDTKGAEMDEFKVLKAQMEQRYGGKQKQDVKRTRKVSDRSMEDYNKLVEADTQENEVPEYENEYRGKVQNRRTELVPEPPAMLTFYTGREEYRRELYNKEIERVNRLGVLSARLVLTHKEEALDEAGVQQHFSSIQSLSEKLKAQPDNAWLHFARALDEYLVQDFDGALTDVDKAIALDGTNLLAYYFRAQVRLKSLEAKTASGAGASAAGQDKWAFDADRAGYQAVLDDYDLVLSRDSQFVSCHYNKGNVYFRMKAWPEAIAAYSQAIGLHPDYAEAYYNRGLAYLLSGNYAAAIPDLSRAGELGLYTAYNLIKRYRDKALPEGEKEQKAAE